MKSAAKWGCGFGLLFIAGLITPGIVSLARQPRLPAPLTLPSGETLIMRGVTFGTNHIAPDTARWLRRLPPALRQRITARFPRAAALFSDRTTPEPRLLLWIEIQPGATTNRPWSTNVWFMLQDERGRLAGKREDLYLWPQSSQRGRALEFGAFPRRGTEMGVILIQGPYDNRVIVGRWQIPNPAPHTSPGWDFESTPLTQMSGDIECTLGALSAGTGRNTGVAGGRKGGQHFSIDAAKPGEEPGAAFTAVFRERGVETDAWTIGSVTLTDATGNVLNSTGTGWSHHRNTLFFYWNPVLWPDETWELRLLAKRTSKSQFPPGEIAELKDVPVSDFDAPVGLDQEITANGVVLRMKEFVLRQRRDPHSWSSDEVSQLKLLVTGLTNGVYLDPTMAIDDEGRAYRCSSWGGGSGSGTASEYSFSFPDLTNRVKRLSFAFAVQRGLPFVFRIRPEFVGTNATFPVDLAD